MSPYKLMTQEWRSLKKQKLVAWDKITIILSSSHTIHLMHAIDLQSDYFVFQICFYLKGREEKEGKTD